MVNNLSPGFEPNGTIDTASITAGTKVPPSALRTIGDELNDNNISWAMVTRWQMLSYLKMKALATLSLLKIPSEPKFERLRE